MKINTYASRLLLSIMVLLSAGSLKAQLQIDSTMTPAQYVQNVLLGQGVTVSNITFTGLPNSISSFTATGTNLGLGSGIMLTTGYAHIAYGPNILGSAGSDVGPSSFPSPAADHDADLDAIIQLQSPGIYSNDAAVLEFDFVPTSDTVKFRYVFGSEEYPEWVGSINDVFAFFLTGPGGYNNTNIALIPGTSTPITIGNVNAGSNAQYYVDNTGGTGVQYDGFTTVMTAVASVTCGLTYHIKIAIGDASDGIYDSAVFLEAGSFSSIGGVVIIPDVSYSTTNDTTMYEGCGDATIKVVRSGNNSQAQTYNYNLTGTATNGVDCDPLSGQLIIPAGQDTGYITLNALADGLIEGQETLIINVVNSVCNSNSVTSVTLYINDVVPVSVNAGPDQSTACSNGNNINLNATPADGVGPYTYSWSPTGDLTQGISVLPANTTVYTVTVTDLCGNQATDDVEVAVEPPIPLTMTLTPDLTICQNAGATLTADVQGGNGQVDVLWNTGDQAAIIQVNPPTTGIYTVTASDACGQSVTDAVTVTVVPVNANFDYMFVSNNSVVFDNQSVGYDNLVWWNFGDSTTTTDFAPTHTYTQPGTYIVTLVVENTEGCPDTTQYSLIVKPDFYFYIPNSFTPNSDGINETFNGKGQGFEMYSLSVYNRWGQRLYYTNSLTDGWDGKDANGNVALNDVYIYVVGLRITAAEDEIIYRGKVSLIR